MDVIKELDNFYSKFKGVKGNIGYSEQNKPIYFFNVKKSQTPTCIFTYAIHAREYITSYLAIEQIKLYIKNGKFGNAYFLPMVNPDGVRVCLESDPLYKANFNGVDLNVNFDARWGTGAQNVTKKSSANYIGKKPFSESETIALRDFTLKVKPDITVSYHSKGEEIYYDFYQEKERKNRDYKIAKAVSIITGYEIKEGLNSAGGYKDWCVEKLLIPSLTIEVGKDNLTHPILKSELKNILKKNKDVVNIITENSLWN